MTICAHKNLQSISIHAPRVGSDDAPQRSGRFRPLISIHAPRVGSDTACKVVVILTGRFQSTLPVWGATLRLAVVTQMYYISIHAPRVGSDLADKAGNGILDISIHAPRVGSDNSNQAQIQPTIISIHAPRVGSDVVACLVAVLEVLFQSTLPVWGATISLTLR